MNREYSIVFQSTENDAIKTYTSFRSFSSYEDKIDTIVKEYRDHYKDDPNFKIIRINKAPTGNIDWELLDRMKAVREICELGHKVRAGAQIKNRQPLNNAYISFTDSSIQNYMIYIDCGKNEYAKLIKDELNILNVEFVDEAISNSIYNYNVKPNFKVLGPKGFGRKAQELKLLFQSMSIEERNKLYLSLKKEPVSIQDFVVSIEDVEVEFLPKENYVSASSKIGAIILDTKLNDNLLRLGFTADLRSALQNARKSVNLDLTDKVSIDLYTDNKGIQEYISPKFKKDLLATEIALYDMDKLADKRAVKFEINGESYYALLYKHAA